MVDELDTIHTLIPHRDPFLWVDRIVSSTDQTIVTEKTIPEDLQLFQGHYPDHPIMPGVLLCEAIFQSGALLMALAAESDESAGKALPMLTRIGSAKFKRPIYPGDTVIIFVKLVEKISSVVFFKGTLKIHGKLAVQVDFSCTMNSTTTKEKNS